MDLAEAKHNLTGPVMSVRPAFRRDGDIDFAGTMRGIDRGIEGGSRTVMLTAGDSHYFCLSEREIANLTKRTCEHVGGRAMVIAADRQYATGQALAFAQYCRDAGADLYMALPPDWAGSCTPETLAEHYAAVADVMPVMIVTNLFIPRGGGMLLETLERATERSDRILALKDDMCGNAAHEIGGRFHDRLAIIAGGQKRNHMNMVPWGVDGYLSTFIGFRPAVARVYWDAIERGDLASASRLIVEKDIPFFDYVSRCVPGGFDAAIHGMMELYGWAGRWRRKPYGTISKEDLAALAGVLGRMQLL